MRTFLYTLHIVTCLSLIVVVLIQRGKGADMGAMLGGGGSQTVFGARGAGNFLRHRLRSRICAWTWRRCAAPGAPRWSCWHS